MQKYTSLVSELIVGLSKLELHGYPFQTEAIQLLANSSITSSMVWFET